MSSAWAIVAWVSAFAGPSGPPWHHRLGELQMPVAEQVPDEAIDRVRGVVEPERLDRLAGLRDRLGRLSQNRTIERLTDRVGIKSDNADAAVELSELRGVPDFGREIAVSLDAGQRKLHVAPLRRHRREEEAERVRSERGNPFRKLSSGIRGDLGDLRLVRNRFGALGDQGLDGYPIDEVERVHDVALRLRHLGALLVADERVDVDVAKGNFMFEMETHHHHPGDPKENDVEPGNEHAGRIEPLQLLGRLGPAERREGPQRRREPRIEHVGITRECRRQPIRIDAQAVGFR